MKYHFKPWNHEIWLNLEVEILTEWNIGLFISIMFRSDFNNAEYSSDFGFKSILQTGNR